MIWSGTPEGISRIYAGDTVVCEIEGFGRLENQLVAEKFFYQLGHEFYEFARIRIPIRANS